MLSHLTPKEILAYYGLDVKPVSPPYSQSGKQAILYQASRPTAAKAATTPFQRILGVALVIISLGAFLAAGWPIIKLESFSMSQTFKDGMVSNFNQVLAFWAKNDSGILPSPTPTSELEYDPLIDSEGNPIVPVNTDFALIVPAVGINTTIVPGVNPASKTGYLDALKQGVAHSQTSYYPDEAGTVYLFSHSTNYEWFIKDLNAVFYYLKNIEPGEVIVIMYMGNRYTYQIREKQVVSASEISYLVPQKGSRNLILQTCWPPGSTWKRMLIFADLVDEHVYGKFEEEMYK